MRSGCIRPAGTAGKRCGRRRLSRGDYPATGIAEEERIGFKGYDVPIKK